MGAFFFGCMGDGIKALNDKSTSHKGKKSRWLCDERTSTEDREQKFLEAKFTFTTEAVPGLSSSSELKTCV